MFDVKKFCNLAGHYADMSEAYRVVFLLIFVSLGVCILFGNVSAMVLLLRKQSFRHKRNLFIFSLISSDLLFGATFIPLFSVELADATAAKDCRMRSWRVVAFTFFFFSRLLSIFAISLQTYIKTTKPQTRVERLLENNIIPINFLMIWGLPLISVLGVGFSTIPNTKVLGLLTLCYFVSLVLIVTCAYAMVLRAIKQAKERLHSNTYEEALKFIWTILIWFLVTSLPLTLCGIVLVVLSYNSDTRSDTYELIEHQIYSACLAIASLAALVNPLVYFLKLKELKDVFKCPFTSVVITDEKEMENATCSRAK